MEEVHTPVIEYEGLKIELDDEDYPVNFED